MQRWGPHGAGSLQTAQAAIAVATVATVAKGPAMAVATTDGGTDSDQHGEMQVADSLWCRVAQHVVVLCV